MKKTLGGDRLGSGKKMQVDLQTYGRSTHDLGYIWRSSMASGTLVPFLCEVALPGDTWDIDLDAMVKTHPTIGPLFGSFKVQLDVFEAPIRLYNAMLHNNMLGIGLNMSQVKLPKIELTAPVITTQEDFEKAAIGTSCLLNYVGIKGVGNPAGSTQTRLFNGVPILAYWEIYKNYYSAKQEKEGVVVHTVLDIRTNVTIVQAFDSSNTQIGTDIPQSTGGWTYGALPIGSYIRIGYATAPPLLNTIIFNLQGYGNVTAEEFCSNNFVDTGSELLVYYDDNRWTGTWVNWWDYISAVQPSGTEIGLTRFQLSNIDDMREAILASGNSEFIINSQSLVPYRYLYEEQDDYYFNRSSQEGLGVKTYQSDLFNNWLDTTYINNINAQSAISTAGGSFTIDALNMANKVFDLLNRVAVSGGTYDDWLDVVYTNERVKRAESPIYHGGLSKELVFEEVVSNASTTGEPLGSLAGKGRMADKHKGGKVVIKVDEPSYIIGIVSLTPRIDYSQGNKWDVNLVSLDDLHKPQMDEIGFQDLIIEQMGWWTTEGNGTGWDVKAAGKQPAWVNYMTSVNRTFGNFAIENNEMFMTLNRRYEPNDTFTGIDDLTSYIDPSKYNFIFAQTSLDAQNFWTQIAVDITCRRKMSAKIMPNL